jgi:predicted RND superfamily exporter protein
MTRRRSFGSIRVALVVATVLSVWLTGARLRLSNDLTDLFPRGGAATTLTRFLRAFGGGDLAVFLVEGDSPDEVERAATLLTRELGQKPSLRRVLASAPSFRPFDPTLAWAYAGPDATARLAQALTPEGMRQRLDGTRELLLAPGAGDEGEWLARDPLRLAAIPFESRTELAAGVASSSGGAFASSDGKARLVVGEPKGSAFEGKTAAAFMADARAAIGAVGLAAPHVRVRVTGGHAIAASTAEMLQRDMVLSSALSTVLASVVFLFTFRRMRALLAVLPPLALGTVWTTGLAALLPTGLSAIATAFAAVVIGVGVDTGVHLYAALLDARAEGLEPRDAARAARKATWRPTLLAALAAGLAFASLALSELSAVRQLGLMCAAGEVLTAVAILLVTPEIGALLERGAPPRERPHRLLSLLVAATRTPKRARIALALSAAPFGLLAVVGLPRASEAIVAIRPQALEPLITQRDIYRRFGSREGQWLVVSTDATVEAAAARADRVAEALDRLVHEGTVDGYDALVSYFPSPATQTRRLAHRDALDLPAKREVLEAALRDRGFDVDACRPALEAFGHPSHDVAPLDPHGPFAWLVSRHLATDAEGAIAVSYVRPFGDPVTDARAIAAIRAVDPDTVVTGYHHLERALRAALAHDLPRVSFVALVLVIITLRARLRRASDVALALLAIGVELACVAVAMHLLGVRWHVYDALVLPVLIGITMDESMFLLFAARRDGALTSERLERALFEQGPLVASTALTTAAGFAALLVCRFEGLRDLGTVGALGSALGLLAALVVVPAGLRIGLKS